MAAREITAVVRTWNGSDVSWGPMPLDAAIKLAADSHYAHRYVEVAGAIVYDHDEIVRAAEEALRAKAARA